LPPILVEREVSLAALEMMLGCWLSNPRSNSCSCLRAPRCTPWVPIGHSKNVRDVRLVICSTTPPETKAPSEITS